MKYEYWLLLLLICLAIISFPANVNVKQIMSIALSICT